jgi:D-alanyl-lipoteichoic acid acyltransferase DltB (MBOAT superfamily)
MPLGFQYLLPVGISFFTFQSLSYTIDFYFGNVHRERNFLRFATFVCFFPQFMAGPIERAKHLLPQFNNPYLGCGLGEFWTRWHISLSSWFLPHFIRLLDPDLFPEPHRMAAKAGENRHKPRHNQTRIAS